jgi:transposase InsO family protein
MYFYVIIDIFSRRVVGWCVADKESATCSTALFKDAAAKHPAPPGQLTVHADRGGPADGGELRTAGRKSDRNPQVQRARENRVALNADRRVLLYRAAVWVCRLSTAGAFLYASDRQQDELALTHNHIIQAALAEGTPHRRRMNPVRCGELSDGERFRLGKGHTRDSKL